MIFHELFFILADWAFPSALERGGDEIEGGDGDERDPNPPATEPPDVLGAAEVANALTD